MVLFDERQHFTQAWLWALLLGTAGLFWFGTWRQVVQGEPWGSNPAPDEAILVAWLLAGVSVPLLFAVAHLRTRVTRDGISVRFFPFHLRERHWTFDEIESIIPRKYRPLGEYGGWGIRVGLSGWAYNVKGRMGVQFRLRSGSRILVGTQDPEGFMAAVWEAGFIEG